MSRCDARWPLIGATLPFKSACDLPKGHRGGHAVARRTWDPASGEEYAFQFTWNKRPLPEVLQKE